MSLTIEALTELKKYFDEQLEITLGLIKAYDSERLMKNKINGFIIAIHEKLLEIKPSLKHSGSSKANDESTTGGRETSISAMRKNLQQERLQSM